MFVRGLHAGWLVVYAAGKEEAYVVVDRACREAPRLPRHRATRVAQRVQVPHGLLPNRPDQTVQSEELGPPRGAVPAFGESTSGAVLLAACLSVAEGTGSGWQRNKPKERIKNVWRATRRVGVAAPYFAP